VRTWGRVKSVDTTSKTLTISDGSGPDLKCSWTDANIDPAWTHIAVTGASSCELDGSNVEPVVLILAAQGATVP
jgi:hypothetical protein